MFVAKIKQVRTMDICSYYLYIHTLVHLIYSCEFEQKLLAGCPPLHEGFVASVHMIVWNRPDDPGTIAQAGESPTHRQAPCEGIPLGTHDRTITRSLHAEMGVSQAGSHSCRVCLTILFEIKNVRCESTD